MKPKKSSNRRSKRNPANSQTKMIAKCTNSASKRDTIDSLISDGDQQSIDFSQGTEMGPESLDVAESSRISGGRREEVAAASVDSEAIAAATILVDIASSRPSSHATAPGAAFPTSEEEEVADSLLLLKGGDGDTSDRDEKEQELPLLIEKGLSQNVLDWDTASDRLKKESFRDNFDGHIEKGDYTVGPCSFFKGGEDGRMFPCAHPQTSTKNSLQMQLDVDSLGPSLSQVQLFSVLEFSPDWAFSGFETKVLILGTFLGGMENNNTTRWCCMFGEVEVLAEVLGTNALRCHAPAHVPGTVPFYVTCSNRLACSEVRQFEYRDTPSESISILDVNDESEEELRLQLRLAKMILRGVDSKWLDCSLEKCEKCILKKDMYSMGTADEDDWAKIEIAVNAMGKNHENPRKALMQKLLKERLFEWLVCKAHEGGKGLNILDDKGQGVIHLAAALGYEWAMSPIVASGISPSFRDLCGWTGLHWAAFFGREETVVALVQLGAAPGAVEDPTSKFPEGRTAADLASSRGHKGIAEYLAQADLMRNPSSSTLNLSVNLAAEKDIETLEQSVVGPLDALSRRK
ncbi:IQ motif [Cinnamomum micranthum f. kanehirae]|uniref:IQ motif n=1 Tax=Cinnamomum micranthum f. kanehirae TaxID=337451 RepID=A0A3S4PT18_9MAGN|nr:IQ motif [Cinnamomum micranthum f. kanehirae]